MIEHGRPGSAAGISRTGSSGKACRGRAGFTLMEVLVAISVFSLALVGIFAIFTDTILSGRSSEGLRGAVTVSDAFFSRRKLQGDGLDWFFEPSVKQAVLEGRLQDSGGTCSGRTLIVTNGGQRYALRLYSRVLQLQPFIYRGFLSCSWRDSRAGRKMERSYTLSTVFVHKSGGTAKP